MELGMRLKEVRLALGLSPRQLCGDVITRNMLSQIENGSARPSMDTLRYLAGRLGKPLSYFLEEETVTSPNQTVMADARAAHGNWKQVLAVLENYQKNDPLFDEEAALLRFLALLDGAEEAMGEGKRPYARDLMEQADGIRSIYRGGDLERRRLVLMARITGDSAGLPSLDEELMIRAENASPDRAAALLDAVEDRDSARWNLLRGAAYLEAGDYQAAIPCLLRAEEAYPYDTAHRLEKCYRELEDYKMAYFYACKQR